MNFEFATATRIIFGEGKARETASIARGMGRHGLLVTGKEAARAEWLREDLKRCGCDCEIFSVSGEPTVGVAERGAEVARGRGSEFVIGLGGGSVIDAGKAIAALATNCGPAVEYLEVIGQGRPLAKDPLPYIAVPTTAGTGAEVTRNAVLASKEHEVKVSLRSAKMLPAVALVDPELTYGLPPAITANTGLDALTQLIEAFVCLRANALTDGLCREAIPRVAKALPVAFHNGQSVAARGEMALGSLFGGLALANAGLGVVHGFAAPIGGMFEAPHGGICAALLPGALAVNLRAVRQRAKAGMERFAELAFLVTGEKGAGCERLVEWTSNLTRALQVPGLRVYGVEAKDCDVLCERASRASSMKANPVELTREELREVVGMAL